MPGTSAPVERIFSLMNNAWSDERGRMNENLDETLSPDPTNAPTLIQFLSKTHLISQI